MKRLARTAATALTVVVVLCALAVPAEKPRGRPHRPPARVRLERQVPRVPPEHQPLALQRQLRMHRQLVEVIEDPLACACIAISRIKDIALKHRQLEVGVEALHRIAEGTDNPVVKRAALLAVADLWLEAGKPREAAEALTDVCRFLGPPEGPGEEGRPEPEEALEHQARRVHHWLREHPEVAREIIRDIMAEHRARRLSRSPHDRPGLGRGFGPPMVPPPPPCPMLRGGPMPKGPCRGPGGPERMGPGPRGRRWEMERPPQPGWEARERREPTERQWPERPRRPERREMQRRGLRPRPEGPRGNPAELLERQAERHQKFLEMLERRSKALEERAAQIERRFEELKRMAAELLHRKRGDEERSRHED